VHLLKSARICAFADLAAIATSAIALLYNPIVGFLKHIAHGSLLHSSFKVRNKPLPGLAKKGWTSKRRSSWSSVSSSEDQDDLSRLALALVVGDEVYLQGYLPASASLISLIPNWPLDSGCCLIHVDTIGMILFGSPGGTQT
jgi:hypothetical protein